MQIVELPVANIDTNPEQPRQIFGRDEILELAISIKRYGLLQPILVKKEGLRYRIIAGERRFRACKELDLAAVKCIITDSPDDMEMAIIENLQRKDLNPLEEAEAIQKLIQARGYTQEEVASIVAKSRPYITNLLRLLDLDEKSKEALMGGKISEGHGRALASIKEEDQRQKLLELILNDKLNVRQSERRAKSIKEQGNKDVFIEHALRSAQDKIGSKLYLQGNYEKGKLVIEYFTPQTLNDILERMLTIQEDY